MIVRQGPGQMHERLPDGLHDLVAHNLITFKSHHESLDAWAIKELIGHYVAYRKLVSKKPSDLLSEDQFRLYAVCARFPQNLSAEVAWHKRQEGVYHCQWGTDTVRIVVAGQLPKEEHNAPLHLFSASSELVGFGSEAYRQHSKHTSSVLRQLFDEFRTEGSPMAYTMQDFVRDYIKKHLPNLPANERREVLESLPAEERLAGLPTEELLAKLPVEEIRKFLEKKAARPGTPRKQRKKK